MVSAALLPVLWAIAGFTLFSVALFFGLLRSGFELRRANLFLRFKFFEPYFMVVSASLIAIVAVEFAALSWAPDVIDLFPDSLVLLMVHAAAILVYLRIFFLLRARKVA